MNLEEKLEKFEQEINRLAPPVPRLGLKHIEAENLSVFESKLGGVPYLPKGMEYPTVREGEQAGVPLRLLAQLNFGKLPHVEGFPEKGILQFFVGGDNIGLEYGDQMDQNAFRVIYHADVIEDESLLYGKEDLPEVDTDDDGFFGGFPVSEECLLEPGELSDDRISDCDFRFSEYVFQAYNTAFGANVSCYFSAEDSLETRDEEFLEAMEDSYGCVGGTCIGGYPYFTQDDPRVSGQKYAECDVLLLQIDSGDGVMWGDMGVGNFFINCEDLKKCDFSKVLYNWDCT